jgi:hypothetical protein
MYIAAAKKYQRLGPISISLYLLGNDVLLLVPDLKIVTPEDVD